MRKLRGPSVAPLVPQRQAEVRTLPAEPAEVEAPPCPLPNMTAAETDMWERYWRKPQAVLWRENGSEIEVALHVRHLCESMKSGASAGARNLVRQQMDSLLLTHKTMSGAGLRIDVEEEPEPAAPTQGLRLSSRERRLAAKASETE